MKVCMICPTYPPNAVPCGVGDYTRELVVRLAASGVAITVVASTAHHPEPGSPVHVVPFATRWDVKATTALLRFILEEGFDSPERIHDVSPGIPSRMHRPVRGLPLPPKPMRYAKA